MFDVDVLFVGHLEDICVRRFRAIRLWLSGERQLGSGVLVIDDGG